MIFNAILAWRFLGERIPLYKVITILIIVFGASMAIYFASYESKVLDS